MSGEALAMKRPVPKLMDQLWRQSMDDTKKKCFDSSYPAPAEGGGMRMRRNLDCL